MAAFAPILNVVGAGFGIRNLLTPNANIQFVIAETTTNGTTIEFSGFETPHELGPFGGEQKIAVHEFPGGIRTIQTLGAFPSPLHWKGILMGASVNGQSPMQRASSMDLLRRHGNQVQVRFGNLYSWTGIVTKFDAIIEHQNRINYECVIEPVSDDAVALSQASPVDNNSLFSQFFSQIKSFLTNTVGLSPATIALLTTWSGYISAALLPVAGIISDIDPGAVSNIKTTGALVLLSLATDGNSKNLVTANAAQQVIPSVANVLQLIANSATVAGTLQTVNPNLAKIAAVQYNDASQWPAIANINDTSDIWIPGITPVMVPNPTT